MSRTVLNRRVGVAAAVALTVAAVGITVVAWPDDPDPGRGQAEPATSVPTTKPTDSSASASPAEPSDGGVKAPASCRRAAREPFAPENVAVPGVGEFDVQSLARVEDESGGISSAGPTNDNPSVFAWDNESAEAAAGGSVLFTAHTFQKNKSALGNRLLKELDRGEVLTVAGDSDEVACYRVTERLEVEVADYPVDRVYLDETTDQAVITVCSDFDGGDWARRTLWFLEPVA